MKKILALLMASVMVLALAACGGGQTTDTGSTDANTDGQTDASNTENDTNTEAAADAISDTMTSSDGKYEVAFVTDVGQLKDKSFNQGTWNGVKLYASQNDKSYKYYQPANGNQATDDDRFEAMKAAVDGGANVVVCAGFLQDSCPDQGCHRLPRRGLCLHRRLRAQRRGRPASGQRCRRLLSRKSSAGYFAGYAAVMEGYTKLGFSGGGGGTNPACCRYGYGYVQGANAAAAKEMNANVEMNYSWEYGCQLRRFP